MKIHVLTIGINYKGDDAELAGCLPDARLAARVWQPYAASVTKVLENKADREGILAAGQKVLERLEPGDLAVVDQSSHGTRERHLGRWVEGIVCRDYEIIYDYEMAGLFAHRVRGSHVFAVVDACHSGTIHRGPGFGNGRRVKSLPIGQCKRHAHPRDISTRALVDCWGYHGCEANDYSYDGRFEGKPQGALHYAVYVHALRQLRPGDSYARWFQLVGGRRPKGMLPNDDYPQQPVCVGSRRNLDRPVPMV